MYHTKCDWPCHSKGPPVSAGGHAWPQVAKQSCTVIADSKSLSRVGEVTDRPSFSSTLREGRPPLAMKHAAH